MIKLVVNGNKLSLLFLTIFVSVSGSPLYSQTQPNLVKNPSFELGSGDIPDNWTATNNADSTLRWTNAKAHSGNYAISVGNISGSTNSGWVSDYIDVIPYTAYEFSYWVFATKAPQTGQYFDFGQWFYDSLGNGVSANGGSVNYTLNQWRNNYRRTIIYPTATKIRFWISFHNEGQSFDGAAYFDDFELRQISPTVSLRLLKPTGRDTLVAKSTYNIQWTSQNISYIDLKVSYKGGGGTNDWLFIAKQIPASQGSYSWNIPDTTSGRAPIWIYDSFNGDYFSTTDNINGVRIVAATYRMTLSSKVVNFGTVKIGQLRDTIVTIGNMGNSDLIINTINSTSPSFTARPSSLTILKGASAKDTIRYSPIAFGTESAKLFIWSNAPSSPDTINVLGNSPAPLLVTSASSLAFTDRAKGDSAVMSLYLKNSSINTMTLGSVTTTNSAFAATTGSTTVVGLDSTLVMVKFKPTAFGTFVDTIRIVSNGGNANITLRGTSPYPLLFRDRAAVDFEDVVKGTVKSQTLVIRNQSINVLLIDSAVTQTRWFGAILQKKPVSATDSLALSLYFTPDSLGSCADTLLVYNNSSTRVVKVPLAGTSPYPLLLRDRANVDFGDVAKGVVRSQTLVIKDMSINTLVIDSAATRTRWFGALLQKHSVTSSDSLVLSLYFTPDSLRAYVDTLLLYNNSSTRIVRVALTGNSPNPVLSASTLVLNLPQVAVGDSVTKSVWLYNRTPNVITVSGISNLTQFFSSLRTVPFQINGLDSTEVKVKFKPKAFGDTSDLFTVSSDGGTLKVLTNGTSPYPYATFRQQRLDFWALSKDSTRRLTVTIADTSANPLRIDTLYSRTKYFKIPFQQNPAIVKKGDSLNYVVTFTPDSARVFIDTIYVQTNSPSSVSKIGVRGEGTLVITSILGGQIPSKFELCQNFPNPFNPSTSITYNVPQRADVSLKIIDVLGRVVAVLFEGMRAPGHYELRWNSNVPSGIYFYRLQAGEFVDTKKMILLK